MTVLTDPLAGIRDRSNHLLLYPDVQSVEAVVTIARSNTHTAPEIKVSGNTVTNEGGYRMAKASHGVITGHWYLQVTLEKPLTPAGTTRIGWSQISGDLQYPAGRDQFSYSWRSHPGSLHHEGVGYRYGAYREGYDPGDVIGLEIYLPPLNEEQNEVLKSRQYIPNNRYEQFKVPKPLPILEGSFIKYYRNGVDMGLAFKDLYLGRYFPAFAAFRGGKMQANFTPPVAPQGARPYSGVLYDAHNAFFQVGVPAEAPVAVAPVQPAPPAFDPMSIDSMLLSSSG